MRRSFEAFRSLPLPVSVSRLDDRRVVDVNDAYLSVFGVERDALLGRTPAEVGLVTVCSARDAAFARLRECRKLEEYELELESPRGHKIVQVWSHTVESDGELYVLSTFIDITERRRQQSAAELKAQLMAELADNIHEVFWLADPGSLQVRYVSPGYERLFGRPEAHLYADPTDWLSAVHADDRARMTEEVSMPVAEERSSECRVIDAAGRTRTLQIRVVPVRDASGAIVRLAGIAEDITNRRHLEEQLRETQKLESLGLLAGGVAHDFNNILAVIAANSSLLMELVPEGHPDRELIDEVDHAVHRATCLTRQLLAFSRKQIVEPVVLDLNSAVNDTRKMLRRMVGEDVVITTSLEPELSAVRIDLGYLVQVLMNLSVNARDAMPRGGTLTISTRNVEATGEVMLAVADTGCGMTPEVKSRVFEPLFTTKDVGKGTGLGLSVVHGIVQQAGGHVEIDTAIDVGTTLRIFLPSVAEPVVRFTNMATAGAPGTEKLIVVDDDLHVRRSIARTLRGRGYDVLEAGDGQAALQLLRDHGKDVRLMVTDVVMPGMDGRELTETARARRPSLPVLYISGYTDDAVLRHGVERSEIAVLEKPFRGYVLAERVRQILDASRTIDTHAPTIAHDEAVAI